MGPAGEEERDAPQPPRAPEPGECCQSGCDRCVYDIYWDAYAAYEEELKHGTKVAELPRK